MNFLDKLEKIFDSICANPSTSKDFRMWLTSLSNKQFPVSLLHKCLKLTFEPPKGVKNNLLRSYMALDQSQFD